MSFTNAVCVVHLTAIVERERLCINVPKQEDSVHSRTPVLLRFAERKSRGLRRVEASCRGTKPYVKSGPTCVRSRRRGSAMIGRAQR